MRQARRVGEVVKNGLGRGHRPDAWIFACMIFLMAVGLIIIYSIGPQRAITMNNAYGSDYDAYYFFRRQLMFLVGALVAFVVAYKIPPNWFSKFAGWFVALGFGLSAFLILFGNILNVDAVTQCTLGACRWISIGGVSLQPAEILKFGVMIYGAVWLGKRKDSLNRTDWRESLAPFLGVVALALFFIVIAQKDMGTGLTLGVIVALMLFVSGINAKRLAVLATIAVLVGMLSVMAAPHRMERVATFFSGDSTSTNDDGAWHIAHAKIAIGSGGLTGVGIGNSVEANGYLPESINDSVFAILGETFGFVGLMAILLVFATMLLRILNVSDGIRDPTFKLIAVGVFGWILSHVMLNVSAMLGLIPLTGITLPLLSYGGTSLLIISSILGMVFRLSRYTVNSSKIDADEYENISSRRGVRRTRYSSGRRSAGNTRQAP